MTFKVNRASVVFLNNLLRNPELLGIHYLGTQSFKHYCTKSQTETQMMLALRTWIEKAIKDIDGKPLPLEWEKELTLSKLYITKIIEMLDHYKELGTCNVTAEAYWRLRYALEGKDYDKQLDDPTDCSSDNNCAEGVELPKK